MSTSTSVVLLIAAAATLSGCAVEPARLAPQPAAPVVPDTNVYFYPTQGNLRSSGQQDRDRYECNGWAIQQTGFDPSAPQVPPHQRMQIVAGGPPPGAQVGAGAVTGAFLGAAVSNPWETGRGALIGALAGAALGGISEAEREHQTEQLQAQVNANGTRAQNAALEQKASEFRRAIAACLEARGYTVR